MKEKIFEVYLPIFFDTSRKDNYIQKKISKEIFQKNNKEIIIKAFKNYIEIKIAEEEKTKILFNDDYDVIELIKNNFKSKLSSLSEQTEIPIENLNNIIKQ